MLKVIVISSFVKFFAVVAMIWVDEFYIHFLLFFSLPAQLQAYKGKINTTIIIYKHILHMIEGNSQVRKC